MLDQNGKTRPRFYIEILELPTGTTPGIGVSCGGTNKFSFKIQSNCETGTFDCQPTRSNVKFSMSMKPIRVGGAVVGYEVTVSDNPSFVAWYAKNITDEMVCDLGPPSVNTCVSRMLALITKSSRRLNA